MRSYTLGQPVTTNECSQLLRIYTFPEREMNRSLKNPAFTVIVLLLMAACASGSAIVTGTTRPAVAPETVRLFVEPPAEYEVIGLVSASSDAGWTEQGDVNYAISELKRRAAKLGANGVLLTATGDKPGTLVMPQANGTVVSVSSSAKTVQGRAIFVRTP